MAEQANIIILGLALLAGTAGHAQPGQIDINQISTPPESSLQLPASNQDEAPTALQVDQKVDRTLLAPPRSDPSAERQPLQQLARGKASAEPAPALSSTDQSRPGPRTVIEGEDRCDRATRQRLPSAACAKVIETRSAEFDRTPAPLSPEQRLLLEQRAVTASGVQGTARRLAAGEGSSEDQAVASIALRQPQQHVDKKEEEKAPLSQEQAAAIVGAILNPPRQ